MNARERARLTCAAKDAPPCPLRELVLTLLAPKPERTPAKLTLLALEPDTIVSCDTLHITKMRADTCVMRQRISDAQRPTGRQRRPLGIASDYPACVTERCAQGRHRRAILDGMREPWEHGKGGSYVSRGKLVRRQDVQEAARHRLQAVGLLDEVPTVDCEPTTETEEVSE